MIVEDNRWISHLHCKLHFSVMYSRVKFREFWTEMETFTLRKVPLKMFSMQRPCISLGFYVIKLIPQSIKCVKTFENYNYQHICLNGKKAPKVSYCIYTIIRDLSIVLSFHILYKLNHSHFSFHRCKWGCHLMYKLIDYGLQPQIMV